MSFNVLSWYVFMLPYCTAPLLTFSYREMNGRFFGGRQIAASFFDESRFQRSDLAPDLSEISAWK